MTALSWAKEIVLSGCRDHHSGSVQTRAAAPPPALCVNCQRRLVESAWGAVSGLLPVRFPRPLAEPAVPVSRQRALHGLCRSGVVEPEPGVGDLDAAVAVPSNAHRGD